MIEKGLRLTCDGCLTTAEVWAGSDQPRKSSHKWNRELWGATARALRGWSLRRAPDGKALHLCPACGPVVGGADATTGDRRSSERVVDREPTAIAD